MTAFETFLKYFGAVMPLGYVALGALILLRSDNFPNLSPSYALILGGIMILYGVYRCYRAYQKTFVNKP